MFFRNERHHVHQARPEAGSAWISSRARGLRNSAVAPLPLARMNRRVLRLGLRMQATKAGTLLAALAVAATLAGSGATQNRRPEIVLKSLTFKRTAVRGGFAASSDLRVRLCLSRGPRAAITTREVRRVGSAVKARGTRVDPLGVDLEKIYPYRCSMFQIGWLVEARFVVGGGTYSARLRVRDGYGRLSAPLAFTVRL